MIPKSVLISSNKRSALIPKTECRNAPGCDCGSSAHLLPFHQHPRPKQQRIERHQDQIKRIGKRRVQRQRQRTPNLVETLVDKGQVGLTLALEDGDGKCVERELQEFVEHEEQPCRLEQYGGVRLQDNGAKSRNLDRQYAENDQSLDRCTAVLMNNRAQVRRTIVPLVLQLV